MSEPAKKKRRSTNLGGRPRVRSGDEVQVTVEFPLEDYAKLAGFVDHKKMEAIKNKESVADQSKRKVLLQLWREFYQTQSAKVRKDVENSDRFHREMKRAKASAARR